MKRWKQYSLGARISVIAAAFFLGIPAVVSLGWTVATRSAGASSPSAAVWTEVARSADDGVFYLDPSTVESPETGVRRGRVLRSYSDPSPTGGGSYMFSMDFNCGDGRAQLRTGVEFVGRDGTGALTGNSFQTPGPVFNTKPGDTFYGIGTAMCRQ